MLVNAVPLQDPLQPVRMRDYPMPVAGSCTCGGYPHTLKCARVLRCAGAPIRL